jgi:site-specific DNA recombinase
MRMKIRLAETKDQPELVELIAHFRDPNCQEAGIIVWKFSRFARDIDDSQFYRADLRQRGFEFYSLNDPVPSGLDGRFFEAAIDWMNQRFLDDLWSDVKCGLRHLVKGYGWKPRTPPRFLRVKSQFLA